MRAKCESKPANLLYKLCWHSPGHELWVVTQRMTLLTQMAEIRVARFSFRDKARLLCLDMTWNQISSTKLGWMDRWVSIVFNQIQTKYGLCLLHLCSLTSVSQTTQWIFYGDHFFSRKQLYWKLQTLCYSFSHKDSKVRISANKHSLI